MKILTRITLVSLILGIVLMVSGFVVGANIESVKDILMDTSKYEAKSFEANSHFNKLNVHTENRNVEIRHGDVSYVTATYYLKDNEEANFDIDSDTLNVSITNQRKWFNFFNFNWPSSEVITLYITLPLDYVIDLDTQTMSGYILVEGKHKTVNLEAFSGMVTLEGEFDLVDISVYSGSIMIKNTNILGALDIINRSGNVVLTKNNIGDDTNIEVMSGSIDVAEILSDAFILKTASGRIDIALEGAFVDYQFKLNVAAGSIKVNGSYVANSYQAGSGILVDCQTSSGNIIVHTQ